MQGFWGAHAPRVLIAAPRRNASEGEKFAMARAPSPAREARALSRIFCGVGPFRETASATERCQDAIFALRAAPTESAENAERGWEWFRADKLVPLPFHPLNSCEDAVVLNPRH